MGALLAINDPTSVGDLATNLTVHLPRVFAYVVASVLVGFSMGHGFVALVIWTGRGTSVVSEHGWLYRAVRITEKPLTYPVVHVLTSTADKGKFLMYLGTLTRFGLRAEGKFAYLVLAAPVKYLFDMSTDGLETSKRRSPITGAGIGTELLYIDGDSIVNVFFGRTKAFTTDTPDEKGLDKAFKAAQPFEPEPGA